MSDDDDIQTIAVTHVPPGRAPVNVKNAARGATSTSIMTSSPSRPKRRKDYSVPDYGVTYEFSHSVNLERVIQKELEDLHISSELRKQFHPIEEKVDTLEEEKAEIEKLFSEALAKLGKIRKEYEDEEMEINDALDRQTQEHDTIVIEDDEAEPEPEPEEVADVEDTEQEGGTAVEESAEKREELVIDDDEDVQIVDTTYESPKKRPTSIVQKPIPGKPGDKSGSIIQVNGPLDSAQLAKLSDGQLIQMVNEDGKKIKTYRVRKVPFYQTQRRAVLPAPTRGKEVLAMKKHEVWYKGTIEEIFTDQGQERYRIRYERGFRDVTGKEIAWFNKKEKLPLGTRVVAPYIEDNKVSYYAGITAEPPSTRNNYRYLVFFDDGYAQYNKVDDVSQVYSQNMNVWEDVSEASKDFIKQYLEQYPERPMVRLQRNQIVKTEWNGKWWTARVQEVDASLVKMYFDADKRTEWIYRGSTRLAPLYTELANAEASKVLGKSRRNMMNKAPGRPYVEYTRGHGDEDVILCDPPANQSAPSIPTPVQSLASSAPAKPEERRPTARKSTASSRNKIAPKPSEIRPTNVQFRRQDSEGQDRDEESLGDRVELSADKLPQAMRVTRHRFSAHQCTPMCIRSYDGDPAVYLGHNPLTIPMYFGWERQIAKIRGGQARRHHVFYRAPCGRRLRSLGEIDRYLSRTKSLLPIDMYCFDPFVHPFMEFRPVKTYCDIKDLSYGKESVPISCVNNCDRKYPDYVEYSNQRLPAKDVTLNLDPAFLCGCDCTDDCRDRSKCACRRLTVQMTGATKEAKIDETAGYHHRRLDTAILTGIYECNEQCSCSKRCHNRVVQNGLALRLQVFKTEKRGWGLRCLDDIPKGGFVCIYAGQLLTDQAANEDGNQYGDEYLAELDHIEMIAGLKEGYEEDVIDPIGSDEDFRESDREGGFGSSDPFSAESDGDSGADMHPGGDRRPGGDDKEPRRRSKRTRRKSDGRRKSADGRKSAQSVVSVDDDTLPDLEKKSESGPKQSGQDSDSDSSEQRRGDKHASVEDEIRAHNCTLKLFAGKYCTDTNNKLAKWTRVTASTIQQDYAKIVMDCYNTCNGANCHSFMILRIASLLVCYLRFEDCPDAKLMSTRSAHMYKYVCNECEEVKSSAWASRDDQVVTVSCPADQILEKCSCDVSGNDAYCDGVTITKDARTCKAHGAVTNKTWKIKAKACCRKAANYVAVVSRPGTITDRAASSTHALTYTNAFTAKCPPGLKMTACFMHTYRGTVNRGKIAKIDNGVCKSTSGCKRCAVQAVCETECDKVVVSSRAVTRDNDKSETKCPGGMVVAHCACRTYPVDKYCDGVTVDATGTKCYAHGADNRGEVKFEAVACCKRATLVKVVSKPGIITSNRKVSEKEKEYRRSGQYPRVSCPRGSQLLACTLHTFVAHYSSYRRAYFVVSGNTCSATRDCLRCGVQVVCVKP